jgi:DNA-directed RNA polymerase specialized sigma24 family protein
MTGNSERDRAIAALRTTLGPVDDERFDRAVADAILCDEITRLPPRERTAIQLAVRHKHTLAQITARTGWPAAEVAQLLRDGLHTITARTRETNPTAPPRSA